jgi:hypothetical protein
MTFMAALRHDGITAPFVLDGPINWESFRIYIERVLSPTLNARDIIVMDNLGSHKAKIIAQSIFRYHRHTPVTRSLESPHRPERLGAIRPSLALPPWPLKARSGAFFLGTQRQIYHAALPLYDERTSQS